MSDVDGVINRGNGIELPLVRLVNDIVDETDCVIVLSSTWRLWPNTRKLVKRLGINFIDVTPRLDTINIRGNERGEEIADWLDRHPEVTRFAILDDDNDMLEEQQGSFFKTDSLYGITREISDDVIAHLLSE